MDTLSYKTLSINKETANKRWFLVNANDQILGRMASKVANIIRGKNKPVYIPHADCGDYVVIINAEKIRMSGKKMQERRIFSHTGYPGGQKQTSPEAMLEKDPTSVVRHAIKGMLPKNKLGAALLKNCYIYAGEFHAQEAQKPEEINLNDIK